jgi:hypothetical protein
VPTRCSLLLLILLAACYPDADAIRHTVSADDAAAGDGTTTPDVVFTGDGTLLPPGATADNCTDFGVAWCEKSRQCGTTDREILGGDGVCPARMKIWCETTLTRPAGTNWTPSAFRGCIVGWTTLSCDGWLDYTAEILKGPGCVVPGKRPEGAGCWNFVECMGLECAGDATCGRCTTRVPAAGPCKADSECQAGLICGQSGCVTAAGPGAGCDAAHPCRRSLVCQGGVCAPRAAAGGACASHDDCAGGLLCNFAKHTCGTSIASPTGCNPEEPDGTVLYCGGGSTCVPATQTCVPAATDGATCVESGPPRCLFPAVCFQGKCALPDPVSCPS